MARKKLAVMQRFTTGSGSDLGEIRLDGWEVPERLPPIQRFPSHILYHLDTYLAEEKLFRKARKIPANQWSGRCRVRLSSMTLDQCLLLTVEVSAFC